MQRNASGVGTDEASMRHVERLRVARESEEAERVEAAASAAVRQQQHGCGSGRDGLFRAGGLQPNRVRDKVDLAGERCARQSCGDVGGVRRNQSGDHGCVADESCKDNPL